MRKIKIDPTCENIMAFSIVILPVMFGAIIVGGFVIAIVRRLM